MKWLQCKFGPAQGRIFRRYKCRVDDCLGDEVGHGDVNRLNPRYLRDPVKSPLEVHAESRWLRNLCQVMMHDQ
jgi:hypothetical protein